MRKNFWPITFMCVASFSTIELTAQEPDTASRRSVDGTQTATDSLAERLKSVTTLLAATQSDLRVAREQNEEYKRSIAALEQSVNTSERRLTEVSQNLAVTIDSLSLTRVSLAESRYTVDTMRVGLRRFLDEIRRRSDNERSLMELVGQKERALSTSKKELERIALERAKEAERLQHQHDSIRAANVTIIQSQADIADLRRQQSVLDHEIKRLEKQSREREAERRRLEAKIDGPARLALRIGFGFALVIGLVMLYLGVALIRCAFQKNAFQGEDTAGDDGYPQVVKHVENQLSYYGAMGHIFRKVIAMQVVGSGMLLIAIVAFVLIYSQDPVKLIGEDGFWKTIAALGVPLAFVTAAYNVIDARRVELVKLSCELRSATKTNTSHSIPVDDSKIINAKPPAVAGAD